MDNMTRLLELLENGIQPVIRWVDCGVSIHEMDCYDIGMVCKVIGITETDFDDTEEVTVYGVLTEFTGFEELNKSIAQPRWYDSYGQPTLKWHETKSYPKNGKEMVYMQISHSDKQSSSGDMFEFVAPLSQELFEEYLADATEMSYVSWLEAQIIKFL